MGRASWGQLGFENQVGIRLGKEPLLSLAGYGSVAGEGVCDWVSVGQSEPAAAIAEA